MRCYSAASREGLAVDVAADINAEPKLESDELWFKNAIIYQLHVKAFADNNNDGIGDFAGLTEKLDYLEDLGVTALWLLPFYPSPGRDDGYDISDYRTINADFGTMGDFRRRSRSHRRCWPSRPDLSKRRSSRLVATAAADCLTKRSADSRP
jgi:alpha amylase-like protein